MRSLAEILLSPVGLAPVTASAEAYRTAVAAAAGDAGVVETLVHDGDPAEPARLVTLFASPGRPGTRPTLLFLHGKGGGGAEWTKDAVRALRLGFNVLVPELRGHAPSTGARITCGIRETNDLLLLLDLARARFGVEAARLGIDGCSYGSLLAVQLAAARAPAALWLQSPFGDLTAMAVHYLHRATGLPRVLLEGPVRLLVRRIERTEKLDLSQADPVAAARRVTCPTTVVHGEADALVPIRFSPRLYEALAGPKSFWRVPACGHCHHADEPQAVVPDAYERRWTEFFLQNVP
ncbi:MAG TPA: alpha/beta hydrolase [Thermoanaerobaculia bacterium]|nr:alpha/beta hydrolase [Thermoanaerobaculia bacterium]